MSIWLPDILTVATGTSVSMLGVAPQFASASFQRAVTGDPWTRKGSFQEGDLAKVPFRVPGWLACDLPFVFVADPGPVRRSNES